MKICIIKNKGDNGLYTTTCNMPTYNSEQCRYHSKSIVLSSMNPQFDPCITPAVTFDKVHKPKSKSNNKNDGIDNKQEISVDKKYLDTVIIDSPNAVLYNVCCVTFHFKTGGFISDLKKKCEICTLTIADCNALFRYIQDKNVIGSIMYPFALKLFKDNLEGSATMLVEKYNWIEYDKYKTLWS